MNVNLLAQALVDAEALYLARETDPPLTLLTTQHIVDKYELDGLRATRAVRSALTSAWREGRLARQRNKYTGEPRRDSGHFVYCDPLVVNAFTVYGREWELWFHGVEWKEPPPEPSFLRQMSQENRDYYTSWMNAMGVVVPS